MSVYADDHNAILISHDSDLFARRKARTFGVHIRLKCAQPDAPAMVKNKLGEIEDAIAGGDVLIEVSKEKMKTYPPRWE